MSILTQEQIKSLVEAASQGRENSYSPYSNFKVGAAVLGEDGKIYRGCNIENVSYGLTNCAERTAIFNMVSGGCKAFTAIAVIGGETPQESAPCGACRQVIAEFCKDLATTQVILAGRNGKVIVETVKGILPYPFIKFSADE